MSRLVCVSNRISVPRRGAAPGGLAIGVLAAMREKGGLWFGWSGETSADTGAATEVTVRDHISFATIDLTQTLYDRYYRGFCNTTLWPLFHYLTDRFRYDQEWHDGYRAVNRLFAERLLPLLKPDDRIWIHDYHLIPLARVLRELGVTQPIGFFLHIPFPHLEVLRLLPAFAELIRDLTYYDLVGFQTEPDELSFRASLAGVFPERAPPVRSGVFPIGIDVDAVTAEATAAMRTEPVRRMVDGLLGRPLIIGVDRLDYSKGLVERFTAYQRFLERHTSLRGRLTYLQIAPLSRSDIGAYAQIRQALEQAAGRTNGRFADTDWTPIRYLNRNFPHGTLMGFMRASQVGLVTPLRDGMNLVAKEYVAAQDPADPGALILSSLAGAAHELTAAVIVNPYDLLGVAEAIARAFAMPLEERRERHAAMLEALRRHDLHAWYRDFLASLEASRGLLR
ncbi:MAG TPA: trehalose-6-phosphate synthase [Steroidobacteraceae bacterium]|nr:trehalose-6-phosphate synthase [Steroidobacteraceae bacterium]HNS28413.1 trehalose-6-phosphate synthase [Steroidobacteraceae bacterium]